MLKHSFVLKTERFDSVFAQEFLVSLPVLFRHGHVIVVITIKFNGKFQSRTVKVQDMMANTELTTKLEASNLLAFQPVPKSSFGWSPISTEFPSVGFHPLVFNAPLPPLILEGEYLVISIFELDAIYL